MDPSVYAYALSQAVRQIDAVLSDGDDRAGKLARVDALMTSVTADVQAAVYCFGIKCIAGTGA